MDTSGRAFVDHWYWAAQKGIMNKNTAHGLRSACTQVLGVLGGWESLDIKQLDVDDVLLRFQNLKKKDFKPQVLETYKRRFKQALASYLKYLEDPGNWRSGSSDRPTQQRRIPQSPPKSAQVSRNLTAEPSSNRFVDYPFPLRDGQIARIVLPPDLTKAEVKRLTAFLLTLAVDSDPEV